MSGEARRLNELEDDIAKLQAHLVQKRRDLLVEIQELDLLRAQLAKNVGCAGDQGSAGFGKQRVAHSSGTGGGERAAESGNAGLDGTERPRTWHELRKIQESIANKKQRVSLLKTFCDGARAGSRDEGGTTLPSPSRVGTLQA